MAGGVLVIFREHALQKQVLWFVGQVLRVPHFFACHDRSKKQSDHQHVYEAARGIRSGWPDTELCLNDGRTFRVELKTKGGHVTDGSAQDFCIGKLNALGHRTTSADSVMAYGLACERYSIPLKANWRTVAQLGDEYVAADIREQEVRQAQKAPVEEPVIKPKRRGKPSPAQIARVFLAMKPLL